MSKSPQSSLRYASDILAWEYDQRQPLPMPGEIEWYANYATNSAKPVLELACGSGRLLIPLARAGYKVHGVDLSAAMLRRLRQKMGLLDEKTRGNISLFQSDILAFRPSQLYSMAMLAYNSVREFDTREKVAAYFKHVYALLNSGGYFLFTIRRLDVSGLGDKKKLVYDSIDKPFTDAAQDISVGVRITSYLESDRRLNNQQSYIIRRMNQPPEKLNFITYTNTIDTDGYVKILDSCKFKVKIYSGYDECPDDGLSKEICVVCNK